MSSSNVLDPGRVSSGADLAGRARDVAAVLADNAEHTVAVGKLLDLHGASGFARTNSLQRFWRDLAVGSRHPQLVPYFTVEDYGRVLLDAEPPVMQML
jgi:alkylation response protein AidB-like acyl-CoA dehydrogenase